MSAGPLPAGRPDPPGQFPATATPGQPAGRTPAAVLASHRCGGSLRHRAKAAARIDGYRHLSIVFAAPAVITRYAGEATGRPVKKLVRTTRRHRTVQIKAGQHTVTAEDPWPPAYATRSHRST